MTTTTNGRALVPHTPAQPARIGQATAVEQSRAVAEVEAAVVVAQRMPRNVASAIAEMRESCKRKELADRAFYRYPQGGTIVTGATVALARELARIWGNIQWGLREMRRDGEASEMLAFAWDVQTNARCDDVVINPHRRYTGGQELTDLRDINNNNNSVGARRVREAIFSVLPSWFVEEAKDLCTKTIADGGGVPLPQRIANAIEVFGNLGITPAQLEAKIGQPSAKWTDHDVAHLRVIRQSLMRNEISKDEEFPPVQPRVTAADITGQPEPPPERPTAAAAAPAATAPAATAPTSPQAAGKAAVLKLDKLLQSLPLGPEEDVRALLDHWCGALYTATRSQVQLVTGILEDHLQACQGDTAEAASAVWAQYRAATAQAGSEGSQDPGGSDG